MKWILPMLIVSLLAGCAGNEPAPATPPAQPVREPSMAAEPEPDPAPAQPPAQPPAQTPVDPGSPTIHVEQNGSRVAFSFTWSLTPELLRWDFGDGATSTDPAPTHTFAPGNHTVNLRVAADDWIRESGVRVDVEKVVLPYIPHVIVGIGDSGFNVYHDVYSRPHLTQHPCTYIRDFPCHIPALDLSLDIHDWDAAFAADREIWESIQPGDEFWIPGTNIIYATCQQPYSGSNAGSTDPTGAVDLCIIDDSNMHGTGTSSSVLSENPDALLAIAEGNSGAIRNILEAGIPVDVVSHSWGSAAPVPVLCSAPCAADPIIVVASGNEGAFPYVLDGDGSRRWVWSVGAADAGSRTEPGYSGWKTMDYVSEYCRPTADTRTTSGMRDRYCGTSFSAPTFAGALSRIIYELRLEAGYTGTIEDGVVVPGIHAYDLRRAINHTATYTPEDKWGDGSETVPLVAPWYQWGWGYFDSTRVDEALACIRDDVCPERPAETVAYMEALWTYRSLVSDLMGEP